MFFFYKYVYIYGVVSTTRHTTGRRGLGNVGVRNLDVRSRDAPRGETVCVCVCVCESVAVGAFFQTCLPCFRQRTHQLFQTSRTTEKRRKRDWLVHSVQLHSD